MTASQRPQDLVFTLFGEYLLHREGPVWVGNLIALLQPFGLSEGAVRTVLSRMTRKGWLDARRVGRRAFHDLSPRGRHLLEEGKARILHPSWDARWDERWILIAYSIPEEQRSLRDHLRDRLGWLGFGSLGNGLWVSPHDVADEVTALADELGIEEHLECFSARRIAGSSAMDLVEKCWDLPEINRHYSDFIAEWTPRFETCVRALDDDEIDDEECYTLRFALIHEFRTFPLEDPYLPRSLLPDDWVGEEATRLFHAIHDVLAGPADRYVDTILADAPASAEPALAGGP